MVRLVPAAVALVSIAITVTDGDCQRVGATEGRMAAVCDHHGNQVDRLVPQPHTGLQRQNRGSVVCKQRNESAAGSDPESRPSSDPEPIPPLSIRLKLRFASLPAGSENRK